MGNKSLGTREIDADLIVEPSGLFDLTEKPVFGFSLKC
jgi:hypothetical protein